jgi:RNA polymerase sigma-70 factor, ECF subfamily
VPETNQDLLEAAPRGDAAAWERLLEQQQHYMYSVALGLVRNPDDAADILQEACIKVVRSLPGYRAESRFTTWLYRLVVNVGLDLLRQRGRFVSLDQEASGAAGLPTLDRLGDPQSSAERSDEAARVRQALDHLPSGQRLALTLHYFGDVRYEEIGEIMGIPLNTVKSHIRRGKEALARDLANLAPTPSGTPRRHR